MSDALVPSGTDYITADQLKAHLGIEDTDDDTAIERAVAATCRAVERYCRRRFWLDESVTVRTYQPSSWGRVQVDDIGSTSGLLVATDDDDDGDFEQAWTVGTDFQVGPANALADDRPVTRLVAVGDLLFPAAAARSAVQVTALFGWPQVPDEVVEACLIKAARLFRRKDTPEGVAGGGDFGIVRVSSKEDPDVVTLLAPYRKLVHVV